MANMNELVVAFKNKQDKAGFNELLHNWFVELGGADNNAVDIMHKALLENDIVLNKDPLRCRASLIGKLGTTGLKTIVAKKAPSKKREGKTKKELIAVFLEITGYSIDQISSLPNLKKADIETLIKLGIEYIDV